MPCKHEGGSDECVRNARGNCKWRKCERQRLYYQSNAAYRERQQRRYRDNPEWRERQKSAARERYRTPEGLARQKAYNATPKARYAGYRCDAKSRGYAFDIPFDAFCRLVQLPCAYCQRETSSMGVDRVDNSRGYVRGNCMPCCKACNLMKSTHSHEEFIKQCTRVAYFHQEGSPIWQWQNTAAKHVIQTSSSNVESTSSTSATNGAENAERN